MAIPLHTQQREPWVDRLKAAGILAVIWIHAFCLFGVEQTLLRSLAVLSRFAVPAFFFTSGFLQAASARLTVRSFCSKRLRRLLIPYLFASVAAILFRAVVLQVPFDAGGIGRAFVIGDAWGIYYFVPVLMVMSAVGELLFRFPKLALPAWIFGSVLGVLTYQLFFYSGDFSLELRNPLRWFGWFAGGWALAVARPRVDGLSAAVRCTIAALLWTAAAGCYLAWLSWLPVGWTRIEAALEYALVCCLILGTAMMAWRGQSRAWVGWLSGASYPIYPVSLLRRRGSPEEPRLAQPAPGRFLRNARGQPRRRGVAAAAARPKRHALLRCSRFHSAKAPIPQCLSCRSLREAPEGCSLSAHRTGQRSATAPQVTRMVA